MVGSALTLALIGLGAVSAAPAATSPEKRQILGGGGTFTWGPTVPTATCLTSIPIKDQPPCFPAGSFTGGFKPPKEKRFWLPDGWNSDINKAIDTLEIKLEALQNKKYKTQADLDEINDIYAALEYLAGVTSISAPPGTTTTIHPGKAKRFWLPDGWNSDINKAIDTLEIKLEKLQNKNQKTQDDLNQIEDIYAALEYLAGVTAISAPPGTTTTIHPGKKSKRFSLPDGWNSDINKAIDTLEIKLEKLQNKKQKTQDDLNQIEDIYAALEYLAGVTAISAPPGTTTTIHPGKRDAAGAFSAQCPKNLAAVELAYEALLQKGKLSQQEYVIAEKLKSLLAACGITIVTQPDGTTTVITIGKRDNSPYLVPVSSPKFDLAGLEKAYEALIQNPNPSLESYLAAKQIASILKLYGITIEKSPAGTTTTITPGKRQITIGNSTCELADVLNFKQALTILLAAYGPPSKAPQQVKLLEQVIVEILIACGAGPSGWTGPILPDPSVPGGAITPDPSTPGGAITPDPSTPGGEITPDPSTPGGEITPDPSTPGGEIHPSDKRQLILTDPTTLLAALQLLENQYGKYGSGTIPTPILLIMENIVTIIQAIPGAIVPDWPILGGAITPSN